MNTGPDYNREKRTSIEEDENNRLNEINHPRDLTLFEFSLLAADYINSYPISSNVQRIVDNAFPNIFLDQNKKTYIPLSSHPYDAGSIHQIFRTPKFDNICCVMEDAISQPFNSFHLYFNSNIKNKQKFGGIDNSSLGSSHRTKIIINTNVSGYVVPKAKEGTGYVTNNFKNGGIHIYTADNFYMTVDREFHQAINTSCYTKVGNNLHFISGSRKDKPSLGTIPQNFYSDIKKEGIPKSESNIEFRNDLNVLSNDNNFAKITSTSPLHIRELDEKFLINRKVNGEENIEYFNNVDLIKNRCDQYNLNNIFITASDEIHMVAGGLVRMSVLGISSSVDLPVEVNGSYWLRTYNGNMFMETHNCGHIGLTTVHGGDIIAHTNFEGKIELKAHDGDINLRTQHRGSISLDTEYNGNINLRTRRFGFINIIAHKGEVNLISEYKGDVNVKSRTGNLNLKTTLIGDITASARNGKIDILTLKDSNIENNTDINLITQDGDINIFARNGAKCPLVNIKSANKIILDAPLVHVKEGDLKVDGTIFACHIDVDNFVSRELNVCIGNFHTINACIGNINIVNSDVGNITTVNSSVGNITTVNSSVGNIITVNSDTINSSVGNINTVNSDTINSSVGNINTVNSDTINSSVGNINTVNSDIIYANTLVVNRIIYNGEVLEVHTHD